jgi:hypothetical protein
MISATKKVDSMIEKCHSILDEDAKEKFKTALTT